MKYKSNKQKIRKTTKKSCKKSTKTSNKKRNNTRKKYNRTKKNKKGGFKNGYICESEGCVFYPSLMNDSYDGVTKLYHNESMYNKEKESYDLFNLVDPSYKYHCEIFSYGLLSPFDLSNKLKNEIRDINKNKSYYYIDMEYAGTPIGSVSEKDNTPLFKKALINFIINVLNLRNSEGKYLIHGDPHPGNICYKKNRNDEYIIKYIDITNMETVSPDTIIKSGTDISRQFSSLMGGIRIVFGFSNKITDELLPIVMSMPERKYGDVLNEILNILTNVSETTYNNTYSSPVTTPRQSLGSSDESPINMEKLEIGKGLKRYKPLFDLSPPSSPISQLERKNIKSEIMPKKLKISLFDDYPSPIANRLNYNDIDDDF